jgi:hypothetical protein
MFGVEKERKRERKMKRTINVDAMYRTKDVHKNLMRFAKNFPEAKAFCEFDDDCTIEEIAKSLPITDKYWADGTVYEDWTYYFNIDFDQDGMYIYYIERA